MLKSNELGCFTGETAAQIALRRGNFGCFNLLMKSQRCGLNANFLKAARGDSG